ncbi:tetratricopeptide repeat-containing sensor histidine kinase [Cesiribacter sp. SM1]|uniref:tetratricopeptide repeat-containing sensor histidine kinase n=1 Tax=Cesiribacter sp. SM1 TaxID=2861196 RepID=UPI001CD700D5|nr:tetratricopeptide repeat-containing sensor histidine kinase [Cesiribacter sp. SM1]
MRLLILIFILFTSLSAFGQPNAGTGGTVASLANDSVDVLNDLAGNLLDKDPARAFALGNQALLAAEQNNFKQGRADAMTILGNYYQDQANLLTALDYFKTAHKLYTEMGDTLSMAMSLRNIGGLFRMRSLYPEAELYYQEALNIGKEKGYTSIIANSLRDLGSIAYLLKQYDKALDYFNQSLTYVDKEADRANYAAVLNNLGVIHKAVKNYRLSLRFLLEAYDIYHKDNNVRDLSAVLMNIGQVQQQLGNFDEAERYFKNSLRAAQKVHNIQRLLEAHNYLAKFYAAVDNYYLAYHHKDQYTAYKDTLFRQEANLQMAEMAKKLEIERKERAFAKLIQDKEMQILNNENEITRFELYRKNNMILVSFLLVILAGGGVYVLYKGFRDKQAQNHRLEERNQEVSLKNIQLQEVNLKLKSSENQLKQLNDTKDKFFGILAHDLRSPLVTLRGFVQILHQEHVNFSQEEMNRLTGRIEHSLRGITMLLDNLLQWSTAQNGTIEFSPAEQKLQRIVEDNVLLLETTAQVKDIKLVKAAVPERVFADKQMLHLVIRNLLGNAIKFTPRGGTVTISAFETDAHTCLMVKDTGIGIAPEKLQDIMKDNTLRTSRGTENEKGSGLGLWLCREFVERHSGTIEIESAEGHGTTFTIKLPTAPIKKPALVPVA